MTAFLLLVYVNGMVIWYYKNSITCHFWTTSLLATHSPVNFMMMLFVSSAVVDQLNIDSCDHVCLNFKKYVCDDQPSYNISIS